MSIRSRLESLVPSQDRSEDNLDRNNTVDRQAEALSLRKDGVSVAQIKEYLNGRLWNLTANDFNNWRVGDKQP